MYSYTINQSKYTSQCLIKSHTYYYSFKLLGKCDTLVHTVQYILFYKSQDQACVIQVRRTK